MPTTPLPTRPRRETPPRRQPAPAPSHPQPEPERRREPMRPLEPPEPAPGVQPEKALKKTVELPPGWLEKARRALKKDA